MLQILKYELCFPIFLITASINVSQGGVEQIRVDGAAYVNIENQIVCFFFVCQE